MKSLVRVNSKPALITTIDWLNRPLGSSCHDGLNFVQTTQSGMGPNFRRLSAQANRSALRATESESGRDRALD